MIKSINSTSPSVIVYGSTPATPYINNNSGAQGVGNVRFNTSNQCMEVYDGYSWIQLTSSVASVGLTPEAESVIDWAMKKRKEEQELEELAKEFPILEDAMRDLEVIKTLVKGKRNYDIQQS